MARLVEAVAAAAGVDGRRFMAAFTLSRALAQLPRRRVRSGFGRERDDDVGGGEWSAMAGDVGDRQ